MQKLPLVRSYSLKWGFVWYTPHCYNVMVRIRFEYACVRVRVSFRFRVLFFARLKVGSVVENFKKTKFTCQLFVV